jgi:hypothetical protein
MTLQHLDTLIGFATVMLGISLLITVMTQLISAVLGLRGTNLRWGLKTLLENVDPTLKDPAQKITEDILHHRLISDSTFSKFWVSRRWRLANAIRRTELIDILKKMVSDPNPIGSRSDSPPRCESGPSVSP